MQLCGESEDNYVLRASKHFVIRVMASSRRGREGGKGRRFHLA